MNQHEEDLQKNIEAGLKPTGDELDIQAYQEVFLRLKLEPEVPLSGNFANNIVDKVIEKRRRAASRDFFWFGVGIFFLLIAFVVALAMSAFTFNFGFLKDMSGYAGLFVFGVVFILILDRLDKKLIHDRIDYRKFQ